MSVMLWCPQGSLKTETEKKNVTHSYSLKMKIYIKPMNSSHSFFFFHGNKSASHLKK